MVRHARYGEAEPSPHIGRQSRITAVRLVVAVLRSLAVTSASNNTARDAKNAEVALRIENDACSNLGNKPCNCLGTKVRINLYSTSMAKILLVEDDDEVRSVLKTLLQEEGHEVSEAAEGNAALEQFLNMTADLVVMDIVMPDKEGLETIIDLKRTHPDVKIMAMSGGGRTSPQDYLDMAKRLGAIEVIAKPFSIDDFLRCVNRALDK